MMNAPPNPQFQPLFQPHPDMRQVQQGNQPQMSQKPVQKAHDPGLAQWVLKKGNKDSWKDVEPQQQHVSLESLHQELERMQKKGISVQRTLNEISSDNARASVNTLISAENRELWIYNRNLEWKIAAIELDWKDLNRKYRQLRRIDVILKTHVRPFVQTSRNPTNVSGNALSSQDQLYAGKSGGMSQEQHLHSKVPHQGQGQNMKIPNLTMPNVGQSQQFGQPQRAQPPGNMQDHFQNHPPAHGQWPNGGQGQGQRPVQGHANPAPPPLHSNMQASGHLSDAPPPPPPPPPPIHPGQQQPHQQHQVHGASGHHNSPMMQSYVEVIDPKALQHQKAKPKNAPGPYPGPFDDEEDEHDDDDSISDASSSQSLTAEELEGGLLNLRRRASRSSRHQSHSRGRGLSHMRSQNLGATSRVHKGKSSRSRPTTSQFSPPPMGKYSGSTSAHHPAKTSAGHLPQQAAQPAIHISVNTANPTVKEHDRERGRRRDSVHINDRPRSLEMAHRQHSIHHDSEFRRPGHDTLQSPRQSFNSIQKIAGAPPPPMSRTSSTDHGSGVVYSDDNSSVSSYGGDSVFSEPAHRRNSYLHSTEESRASRLANGGFRRSGEEVLQRIQPHPDFDRRGKHHHSVSDYPASPHPSRHNRNRSTIHQDVVHHGEDRWPMYDDEESTVSWPPHSGRRSTMPNPFDTARYPPQPQRSMSYTTEPAYTHFPAPKALTSSAMHDPYNNMKEVFEAGLEAMSRKNIDAYEHMDRAQAQRQPLRRSMTSTNGRGSLSRRDVWANPAYADGRRQSKVPARLADGTVVYVDLE